VILSGAERRFVDGARTATLATIDPRGRPRLVPICFVVVDDGGAPVVYTPLDDKPKRSSDPRRLARVTDVLARPAVELLVDRWSEDWSQLGWLRLSGEATLVEPGSVRTEVIEGLRSKYPQYAGHRLESRPVLRIEIQGAKRWGALLTP
jgi:PPOX class probable F420-dependent enzyme